MKSMTIKEARKTTHKESDLLDNQHQSAVSDDNLTRAILFFEILLEIERRQEKEG